MACATPVKEEKQEESVPTWSGVLTGRGKKLTYFPDTYANYWDYGFSLEENARVGLKITGSFPRARFLNFCMYDEDRSHDDISSIEDCDIVPDGGKANPFVTACDDPTKVTYTIYILPDNSTVRADNVMRYPVNTNTKMSVIMRLYCPVDEKGEYEEQGDVPLPTITAVDPDTLQPAKMPKTIEGQVVHLPPFPEKVFNYTPSAIFLRAETGRMYPNRPSQYLYTPGSLKDGEMLIFRFKPISYPKDVSEYGKSDVRYWSVCACDGLSYAEVSTLDKDTKISKDGWTTFILIDKDDPNYEAVKEKAAKSDETNILEWNSKEDGQGFMVFYRFMEINPECQHSPTKVETYYGDGKGGVVPKANQIGHVVLGDWGPVGKMIPTANYLDDAFSMESIRKLR